MDKHRHRGNSRFDVLSRWRRQLDGGERNVLALNVLLIGDRQSGRSSVGNALIGGYEFKTGPDVCGVAMTTEYQVLSRNYPRYFRRQGAESDLTLRVVDTPPLVPHPQGVRELCPEGVHVIVLVTPDWLSSLSNKAVGGALFLDNSCDWPSLRGQPVRERVLRLSARNHHRAVAVRTEVSL
ncbi:hypothetical protein JOB18_046929 [Solea senegalensis]|uniref:AIG1-type G domain-containing protein n=1 Tax=Solea senegalensis TaxID=28829 RepID=A0AAV6QXJ6_SOLSE|nr:hypothetical protein JOB18_046929 [Solea senegalensis]